MRAVHSSKNVSIDAGRPGSLEKIAEFARRLAAGEPLFRDDDASCLPDHGDLSWSDRGVSSHNVRVRVR